MTDNNALINEVDEINREAWNLRVSDSVKAHELSKKATELAKALDYASGKAAALRTLGFTCIRLSEHEEATEHLTESLKLFEALGDFKGQSDVYEYFGIIHRSRGEYSNSLDALYKSLSLRRDTGYREGESLSLYHLGVTYRYLGSLEKALDFFLQSLAIARTIHDWIAESYSLNNLGSIYLELNDLDNALQYFQQSLQIRHHSNDKWGEAGCYDNIGYIHFKRNQHEKAIQQYTLSLQIANSVNDKKGEANSLYHLAEVYDYLKQTAEANDYAQKSLEIRKTIGDKKGAAELYLLLAAMSGDVPNNALAEVYLKEAVVLAEETKAVDLLQKIHLRLYNLFKEQQDFEQSLKHLELFYKYESEIHSKALNQKILNLEIEHKIEQSKKEAEIFRLRNEELAKLFEETTRQKEEIQSQKLQVEKTLAELKTTQAQLIHSEKMASLGELTAGIAHEIQNPLNFVNNFSDLNKELIAELKEELDAGNIEDVKAIANDIQTNEEKISHHGKRAESIVTGMLEHSRSSSGQKEPTGINKLADEYLRLAYHGIRAKDKNFNCDIVTEFDDTIDKINIVPQDIGRVILNLVNNAFYAVKEKSKQLIEGYKPGVSVTTKKDNGNISINVADNGNGIPQKIKDKIFNPFFTTKPTGQGTGLGLSLSYDIVKAHGGEIKLETKEGRGTTFTISIPAV